MKAKRAARVADLLRKEITDLLLKEIKDPGIGFITVTGLDLSNDLRYARVYVSVMDKSPEQSEVTFAALQRASGFIRHRVYKNLRLKHAPEIKFFPDESIDRGFRIDEVLKELEKDEEE
jgi:ribosome-binding factor A